MEDGHKDAVGGTHREQVHHHRFQWDEDAAEHDHQQQEAEDQHGGKEIRHPVAEVRRKIDGDSCAAADEGGDPGGGDDVVAQSFDELLGLQVLRRVLRVDRGQAERQLVGLVALGVLLEHGEVDHPCRTLGGVEIGGEGIECLWSVATSAGTVTKICPFVPGPNPSATRS